MSASKLMKHSTLTALIASVMSVSSFLSTSSQAYAATLTNGGFETGDFTGWGIIGDASIQTAKSVGSGSTAVNYEALLSTASLASDNFNISGNNAVEASSLEAFLGLNPGSLNSLTNGGLFPVTQGSAIKQTFTANAGDSVSFKYNFLTDEFSKSDKFNVFAFTALEPSSPIKLADTFSSLNPSSTFFDQETGFQTFSTIIPTTGQYTLELGVVDVGESYISGLLVSNVQVVAKSVPEPSSTFGVLVFGTLTGVSLLKRKQQQN